MRAMHTRMNYGHVLKHGFINAIAHFHQSSWLRCCFGYKFTCVNAKAATQQTTRQTHVCIVYALYFQVVCNCRQANSHAVTSTVHTHVQCKSGHCQFYLAAKLSHSSFSIDMRMIDSCVCTVQCVHCSCSASLLHVRIWRTYCDTSTRMCEMYVYVF
jgi:hypothetical protein